MRKVKIVGNLILVTGMILLVITLLIDKFVPIVGSAGMITCCAGVIYFFIKWRCPFCKKALPTQGMIGMTYCPYCSNKLD